jgi:peptidoglycan/xylan/chitin deacetylase (PgdA/CDA1 family)
MRRRAAVAVLRAALRRGPVILCYHGVEDPPAEGGDPEHLLVAPARFREQVELLRDAGVKFVTVSDIAARPAAGHAALSFDDGFQDNHSVVLPLLEAMGVPATVFVATGLIGQPHPHMPAASGVRMMTEDELGELAAAGVELGAHTVTHPDLRELAPADQEREVRSSREHVERITGAPVGAFAYPFFFYDDSAREAVRAAGLRCAVTGHGSGSWDDPYALPRALVTGKDGLPSFVARVAGWYDPLFHSRAGRALRAATRVPRRLARGLR